MGVKIAEKLEQFNNGTYYLVDSSAVEYVDKNGDSHSVKDVLDNTSTDNSRYKTVAFSDDIDMGRYLLLAKITGANYTTNNIIKFSCPNFKGQGDGFNYEDDMDIYKFELHFNTGSRDTNNDYGVTLKQHGLVLYSYPLNNPQNTAPRIEEAVRLYWDYNNGVVYVFLVDMEVAIPHCVLEYTGSGTLLEENAFVMDTYYNWQDGLDGTWEASNWKSISYDKLETPPIYELGGDGGSTEYTKTFTSLNALGLTADATVQDVIDVLPIGCTALLRTDGFTNWSTLFNGIQYGYLKVEKTVNALSNIELQEVILPNRRYFGAQSGGKFYNWQQIHTKKEEEDSYIPDMYDRNANGDMPVVPFDRVANFMAVRTNRGLVSTTETETTYNEDYVGGYVFSGANDVLVKDKEMFNKIKVLVHIPGVLRIGIVNEKIYEANPRYSTCLVKWLVADFVAFTGLKEYDIADTVLEEGQSIFLECRTGVSSWYLNTGEATQVGAVTYPASSCTTGLNVADTLDTTTNNALFKSQKVNSSSCLTSFGNGMYSIGGKIRGNFQERAYNSGATTSKETYENTEYFGGLNIGLYRRTKYSDTRVCKCIENAMNNSWVGDDSVTKIYAPYGQEGLVGKSVYAFKLDVRTPGNLTIYHLKGKSLNTIQIIDKYTHYVRGRGLQTIHLPFDIKLNSTDEYIGFGGLHCKSTSSNIVRHSCCWHYLDVSQATWMTTIDNSAKRFYSIGVSMTSYPEKFTSFETNSNYLNIELICRGEKRSPLEDKYISFTGDSITTYTGFCTTQAGYPEGNPAGDNAVYYPASGKVVNNIDATWWGILAKDNRMKILRNDAWSGSRVSSTTGSTDTKCLCGTQRRYNLRNGYAFATNSTYPYGRPEIIVSMIGTNDLSGGVELGEEMFKGVMGAEEEYKTILSAFSLFCRRIHDQEGNGGVKIVHFLIPRGSDYGYANANGVTIADLSLHFERIAKAWGQYFIPLSYFNGIKPNAPKRWSCPTGSMFKNTAGVEFPSADGLHPNAMGMEVIADGVHRFLCSIM